VVWDRIAGPCCFFAKHPIIRRGLRRGADEKFHIIGCDEGVGDVVTLAEAARG